MVSTQRLAERLFIAYTTELCDQDAGYSLLEARRWCIGVRDHRIADATATTMPYIWMIAETLAQGDWSAIHRLKPAQ